ncbi:MAG: HNH endonuclease [Bryobacterales bacterium]|nr:HNH endonuclease [Bryobacterales bacterium]
MITPLKNESGDYYVSFTLGYERTEQGFLKFRFEFRPTPGFWLDSPWFVPSTVEPATLRLINRLWRAKELWDFRLTEARLDVHKFFQEFKSRVSLEDHIAYREERKPLSDLSLLDAAYIEWGIAMASLKEALREDMCIEDICTLRSRTDSMLGPYFAYRKGMIWQSPMNLKPDQWRRVIDEEMERLSLIIRQPDELTQEDRGDRSVSVTVRREVWRRDQGRCVRCGSKERLEYDHIIPIAMGGSNTVRNIQLLCERCNRVKGATLG